MKAKLYYPSNQRINDYALSLIESEMSRLMPESVREGCHKVVAGLDLLLAYYGRYEIYMKSVKLDPERLYIKHNGDKWHTFPAPLQNKMVKAFQAQQKDIYHRLDEMKKFLENQQKFMADMTDAQYDKVVELQEEYEQI